jgi:hypothetical protein
MARCSVTFTRSDEEVGGWPDRKLLVSPYERLFNDCWYDLLRIQKWRGSSCLSLELIRLFGPRTFP